MTSPQTSCHLGFLGLDERPEVLETAPVQRPLTKHSTALAVICNKMSGLDVRCEQTSKTDLFLRHEDVFSFLPSFFLLFSPVFFYDPFKKTPPFEKT